jgi:hypothetical protein
MLAAEEESRSGERGNPDMPLMASMMMLNERAPKYACSRITSQPKNCYIRGAI